MAVDHSLLLWTRAATSRSRAFAAALALGSFAPAQQLWFAQNDNTTYGSYAVGWPSSVIAFRFTAPGTATVAAAQVFTGNQMPAAHSVELRQHDATSGLPGSLVGQPGSWTSVHARCWQGAVLVQPAALSPGQDYWLVWRVQGMFPQHSVAADNLPGNVLVETRYSDGATWHAQAWTPAKFRLFSPHGSGATAAFGTATPGIHGTPRTGISGWPAIGSPIDVWLDDAARQATTFLLIGLPIQNGVPLPFGTLYTTADAVLWLRTATHTSPFVGATSHTFRVPNLPGASGFPLTFQWAVLDPAAPSGIAHTAAVTATLQ